MIKDWNNNNKYAWRINMKKRCTANWFFSARCIESTDYNNLHLEFALRNDRRIHTAIVLKMNQRKNEEKRHPPKVKWAQAWILRTREVPLFYVLNVAQISSPALKIKQKFWSVRTTNYLVKFFYSLGWRLYAVDEQR